LIISAISAPSRSADSAQPLLDTEGTPVSDEPDEVFGNPNAANTITVYLSPTCPHCAEILGEIESMEKNKELGAVKICIILLPTNLQDIYVMKYLSKANISYSKFTKQSKTVKLEPASPQKDKEEQSKTVAETQAWLLSIGCPVTLVEESIPDMTQPFEISQIAKYKKNVGTITETSERKEINLPFIVRLNKIYKSLTDAINANDS
jgi:hypothetical protein